VFINNSYVLFACLAVCVADVQGNLVVVIEIFPNEVCEFFDVLWDSYLFRFTFKGWDWVTIALVGVDEMTCALFRSIGIGVAAASGAGWISTLKDAELITEGTIFIGNDAADTRGVVWSIRLEAASVQSIFKCAACCDVVTDRVSLIAVSYDKLVVDLSYRVIDDKAWINHLGWIKSLGADAVISCRENSVAAVFASAHDEVCYCRLIAGWCAAQNDATAWICVFAEKTC